LKKLESLNVTSHSVLEAIFILSAILHMPVPFPLQPAGINLPPQPQEPPTLADVVAAKHYQAQANVAVGQPLAFLLLIHMSNLTNLHSR
jgi:hypothetical protein